MLQKLMITKGSIVRYAQVLQPGEEKYRFFLLDEPPIETSGWESRVRIQAICDLPFKPIETVSITDIIEAEDALEVAAKILDLSGKAGIC